MSKRAELEFNYFMRRLALLVVGAVVVVGIPLILYAIHLEQRLDTFEGSLRYRGPEPSTEASESELQQIILHPAQGQTVYVPAYSHIYHQDGKPLLLTITLSVRNTSVDKPITVSSVQYYDTNGTLIRSFLARPLELKPLATAEFLVERNDAKGGSGANFLVDWVSKEIVSEPIIESVMIDTSAQQGVSFTCGGVVVKDLRSSSE